MRASLTVAGLLVLAGCDRPNWQGWVYPRAGDLKESVAIGRFDSLDECRRSARALIANFNIKDESGDRAESDYECGRACKPSPSLGGINVCEETAK